MNRQKLACLGFVLSIFGLLATAWLHSAPAAAQTLSTPSRNYVMDRRIAEDERFALPAEETANNLLARTAPDAPSAVWFQSNGPDTGNPFDFLRRGQRLFTATFGGLFVSDDNGENWAYQGGNGLPNGRGVTSLAANAATMFLGMNFGGTGGGIYRSTNNGQTWAAANNGFATIRSIQDLLVDGNNIFAVTFVGELFRSTDNGDNWARMTNGLPNNVQTGLFGGLTISNGALLVLSFAASPQELYRSTDNGTNWTKVTVDLSGQSGVFLPLYANSTKAFLGTRQGLLSSVDGGLTWQLVTGLPTAGYGYGAATSGNTVYAFRFDSGDRSNDSTVYFSTDNGVTWTQKTKLPFSVIYTMTVEGPTVFFGLPAGVVRMDTSGESFAFKNKGLRAAATFGNIVTVGNRIFLPTWGDGVWSTTDGGASWQQKKNGLPLAAFVGSLGAAGNTLYAALEQPLGFYRSTDFGENWTKVSNILSADNFNDFTETMVINDGKIYLCTGTSGVKVSTDNGATFQAFGSGIPANADATSILFKDLSTVIVGTLGQGVFRSTDGGATFTVANTGLTSQFSYGLIARGTMLFLAASNGVFRSTDNGVSWTLTTATAATYFTIAQTASTIYAAGLAGCLFSTDNGATWQTNNTGLFGRLNEMATLGNRLVIGTVGNSAFVQAEDDFANVSAASYNPLYIADKSIIAAFGAGLTTATATAATIPLPTTLAGASIKVRDFLGVERLAPLFFVSPTQINYQIPPDSANGPATVTLTTSSGTTQLATLAVRATAPSLFAANATGSGAAAALDAFKYTLGPFDAKQANGEPNILAVFGTGLGGDATDVSANVAATVTTRLNGVIVPTLYAGTTPGLVGLNQYNVQLPANLAAGTYPLTVTRGGVTSNSVTITIR